MLSRALAALLVLAATIVVLGSLGFRVNLTASLPLGVYRVSSEPPSRGSIVHVCLPSDVAKFARRRGYLGPGSCPGGVRPLGKIVVAAGGDIVALERDEVRVNGEIVPNSGTVSEDSRGRELPHYTWGDYRIGSGEFWLFSPHHRNGFDSRYFGPVRRSQVVSVLRPLWVQGRADLDSFRFTHAISLRGDGSLARTGQSVAGRTIDTILALGGPSVSQGWPARGMP